MKIICKNPKNYNLTLNKEYEVLDETPERVLIINDKNKTLFYAKSLFTEIAAEEVQNAVEIPVAPPLLSEQEMIETISINEEISIVEYLNQKHEKVKIEIEGWSENQASNSCGIGEVDNVMEFILHSIEETVDTQLEDLILFKQELFKKIILKIKEELLKQYAFIMFSMPTSLNIYEDYVSVLNNCCQSKGEPKVNPNSGNTINFWMFY